MAETKEKENRTERAAPFTDADYIPRSEAPKMPRVFSNADMAEPAAPEKRGVSVTMTGILCMAFLFLGLWLGSRSLQPSGSAETGTALSGMAEKTGDTAWTAGATGLGDAPSLGITVETLSPAAAEYYRLYCDGRAVTGAQIYAVEADSAAEKAGLRAGDILVSLGGETVSSAEDLSAAAGSCGAGEQTVCTVFRDGALVDIPVSFAGNSAGEP